MRDSSTFSGDGASPWRVQPSEERSFTGSEISSSTAATRAIAETRSFGSSRGFHDEDPPMTLLLEEPTAQDDQNAQLLFKEARRRRRRLRFVWMAMGAIVIVVFVGLGLTLDRSSSPPAHQLGPQAHPVWPPHLRTGATLVYALNDLRILDADSGATRVLPLPAPYGGSRDLAMVTVGHSLLLNRGDTAWLYSGSINTKPVDLGPSDGVFRGPNSNEAWVWTQPCAPILGCTNYNAPRWEAFTWSMVRGAR